MCMVTKIRNTNDYLVRVGGVSFQANKNELIKMLENIAKQLDITNIPNDELQKIFQKFDEVNIQNKVRESVV